MASIDDILWSFGFDLWALDCVIVANHLVHGAINHILMTFDFVDITQY